MNYTQGNLITLALDREIDVLVHGCNCFNRMGAGLAKTIRDVFPEAYDADCETIPGDRSKLGTFTASVDPKSKCIIVNAYTQYNISKNNEDVFEYHSFKKILNELLPYAQNVHFGFPYIGCGLAGGDQSRIVKMIYDFSESVEQLGGQVTLVEFV